MPEPQTDEMITRRQWLTRQAILRGTDAFLAREAVSSVAIEHPEWDMNETKTMHEWERAAPLDRP